MWSEPPSLVDTNVLVYAFNKDSEFRDQSRRLLDQAQDGKLSLAVTPQIMAEFYAVVTNPKRVSEARQPQEALNAIKDILTMPGITMLPVPSDVVGRWADLVRQDAVIGSKIFDVQLVATMLGNDVRQIYTFNLDDFNWFEGIFAVRPR